MQDEAENAVPLSLGNKVLGSFILLGSLAFISLGIFGLLKWRLDTRLDHVESLARAGDFQDALQTFEGIRGKIIDAQRSEKVGAYVLKIKDPEKAFRLLLEAYTKYGAESFDTEDLLDILEIALLANAIEDSTGVLADLKMRQPFLPEVKIFEGWFIFGENKPLPALAHIRLAMEQRPEIALGNLLRGQILLQTESEVDRIRAIRSLLIASKDNTLPGLAALRLLAESESLLFFKSDREYVALRLSEHPYGNKEDKALSLVMNAKVNQ